jgi:hypothetical protein
MASSGQLNTKRRETERRHSLALPWHGAVNDSELLEAI